MHDLIGRYAHMTIFALTFSLSALTPSTSLRADSAESGELLRKLIADKWGADRVLMPTATVLVQYEADLGERWIVDFESGEVVLECLWPAKTDLGAVPVQNAMACAVSNLYVSTPSLPGAMLKRQQKSGYIPGRVPYRELKCKGDSWTYTVTKGDTLSAIAKRFRVQVAAIVDANNLRNPDQIIVGKALAIPEPPPHMHLPGEEHARAAESLLRDQLADPDTGEKINSETVGAFGRRIVQRNGVEGEPIRGADGKPRHLSRLRLSLAKQHLQVRARRYYPLVREHAERFGHDPAIIMAMVHTESAFNPMAASGASAYGLMQLVPSSGAREAYRWLHSKDMAPTPDYLMRPRENIELGTAYLRILQERMFEGVEHPTSRLYCAVAAYNGGAGNVGRTFTGRKSVQTSLDKINTSSPEQVLQKLRTAAPHEETRDYVRRVFERTQLYRSPAWSPDGV